MLFTPVVGFFDGHVYLAVPNPSPTFQLRCGPVGSDSQVYLLLPNLGATHLSDLGFVRICALVAVATVNSLYPGCARSVQHQILYLLCS